MNSRVAREDGQAMVEYAVILALICSVLVFAFTSLGATTFHLFDDFVSHWP